MSFNTPQGIKLASDSFVRANENPLSGGGNWSTPTGVSPLKIVSNLINATTGGFAPCVEVYSGIVWPNDQYSQVVLASAELGSDPYGAVVCRQSAIADTSYCAEVGMGISPTAYMTKRVAGIRTILTSVPYIWKSGDILRLEVQGTIQRIIINGITVIATNDATLTSGSAGIGVFETTIVEGQLGPWEGGSVTTPAIVTPLVGPGTSSLASPLLTPGYPMVSVQKASPLSEMGMPSAAELPIPSATVRRDLSLTQANEIASRVV